MNSMRISSTALALAAGIALVAGAVAPAAAASDPAKVQAQTQSASSEPKQDKRLYCVEGKALGSNMIKRECRTRTDWIDRTGVDPARPPR